MDIPCTHMCFYQCDGKCTLRELPAMPTNGYAAHDVDCPYFSEGGSSPAAGVPRAL